MRAFSRGRPALQPAGGLVGAVVKIVLLGMLNALALWALPVLLDDRQYMLLGGLFLGVACTDYVFLSRRAYPLRFLLPGLFFMALMVIYPIGYTVAVSFTNFGIGHILTLEQAMSQYTGRYILKEDLPAYKPQFFRDESGQFAVFLTGTGQQQLVGIGDMAVPLAESPFKPEDIDNDGIYEKLGPYQAITGMDIFAHLGTLQNLSYDYRRNVLKMRNLEEFATYAPRFRADKARRALVDLEDGTVYRAINGNFTSADGVSLDIGYKTTVGWRNFKDLLLDRRISVPFFQVFSWTVIWALLSVLETFTLGMFLAVLLNDRRLKFKGLYRVLLIIPYAMPAFISGLIWRGLFNTEIGVINGMLQPILGRGIPWLQDPFWAKVALLIVNLWLGFPYAMLVSLGALQSIPGELYESAMVDGATGWQQFSRITLPLVLVALTPLLIASFAFNFNNFTVIYMVTKGRPAIPNALTPTGATDILISYTYRMAFEGGSGGNYGLAAAVSLLIFLIVGALSWINFKFTGALEEVSENA